jgi:hypothetical protein
MTCNILFCYDVRFSLLHQGLLVPTSPVYGFTLPLYDPIHCPFIAIDLLFGFQDNARTIAHLKMFIGIDKYRFFKCRFADREIIDMRNHLLMIAVQPSRS